MTAMRHLRYLVLGGLALPAAASADALFGSGLAGDRPLPRTWGVGVDYFDMSQPYRLDDLVLDLPPLAALIPDPSVLPIDNAIRHTDLHVDVWVTPFLNLFGIYGRIDGETTIDLGVLGLPLPPATNTLQVDYDGDVFGYGAVLAAGGDRWFASLTGTFTDTNLSGDFDSSVKATTIQPRLGVRFGDHTEFWVGGYLLDAEEKHSGTISLDLGPFVPFTAEDVGFAVDLSQDQDFNASVGMHTMMSEAWEATVEIGAGDRRTVLANVTYRFE
jgi:hypothetical protein